MLVDRGSPDARPCELARLPDVDQGHPGPCLDPLRRPAGRADEKRRRRSRQPAGRSRIVQLVALPETPFAVAVSPPVVAGLPAVSAEPWSAKSEPMRPPPCPVDVARAISPCGAVQLVVALFLSAQKDTRHAPSTLFSTSGVVCERELSVPGVPRRS